MSFSAVTLSIRGSEWRLETIGAEYLPDPGPVEGGSMLQSCWRGVRGDDWRGLDWRGHWQGLRQDLVRNDRIKAVAGRDVRLFWRGSTRALLDRCAELLGGWLVLTRLDFDLPQEGFDFKVADTTPIGGGFRGQEWPFLLCEAPNSLEGSSLGGMELPEDVVALCAQISDTRSLQILVEVATYLAAGTGAWVEFNTFSPLDGDGCVQMMEPISYPTHTVYSYAVTADWLAVRGSGVGPILM